MTRIDPTITRVDDHGHVVADFPDPPRPTYEVAHEVLVDVVALMNRMADVRERLRQSDWIVCAEALRILDPSPNATTEPDT